MNRHLLAITAVMLFSVVAHAEDIRIPIGQGTEAWQGETPRRGLSKALVESQFGSPDSIRGPNGEPPIYYWEYPDFTVYFESDHVIHSVVKHRPQQ